jgi:hypothetical protein
MTLGEQIWAAAIKETGPTLYELGKIVIRKIDEAFDDLQTDHKAEITAIEDHYEGR